MVLPGFVFHYWIVSDVFSATVLVLIEDWRNLLPSLWQTLLTLLRRLRFWPFLLFLLTSSVENNVVRATSITFKSRPTKVNWPIPSRWSRSCHRGTHRLSSSSRRSLSEQAISLNGGVRRRGPFLSMLHRLFLRFTSWSEIGWSDAHIALVGNWLRARRLMLWLLYKYFLIDYINLVRGYIEVILISGGRFLLLLLLVMLVEGGLRRTRSNLDVCYKEGILSSDKRLRELAILRLRCPILFFLSWLFVKGLSLHRCWWSLLFKKISLQWNSRLQIMMQ